MITLELDDRQANIIYGALCHANDILNSINFEFMGTPEKAAIEKDFAITEELKTEILRKLVKRAVPRC